MARELATVIGLRPSQLSGDEPQLRQAADRLKGSGYPLRQNLDFAALAMQRADHHSCVSALAKHLGKPTAILVRQA